MTNEVYKFGPPVTLSVVCTNPTTPAAGDPCRVGDIAGVAITDERADGTTTVNFGPMVADLSVKGVTDGPSNSAVAIGDPLFYVDADTPKISKKKAGYFIGWALETVGSGSTATIQVLVTPRPVGGSIGAGTVGTTELADANVTAAKLTATMALGFHNLDITTARIISGGAIQNTSEGGLPDGNTSPSLARVNGATDRALRLTWAGGADIEIQFAPWAKPPDLDDTATLTLHLLTCKDANNNATAKFTASIWDGVGDTNAGGDTASITETTPTEKTVTLAAADLAAAPGMLNISVITANHAGDAIYLYAAWIEYARV